MSIPMSATDTTAVARPSPQEQDVMEDGKKVRYTIQQC